ncbi:MAG: hypothetical protein WD991_00010 [Candidatus Paceibacterota bacterium]
MNTPVETISWSALEYEHTERSDDWFWALGVIVFASAAASAIFGNYFFALLIVLSGILLGYFATKHPDMVTFELNDKGIKIHDQIYLYQSIKSFWIDQEKPNLFIRSDRIFVPIISVPLESYLVEKVHEIFTVKGVIEEEMKEHPSEKIMDFFGF